MSYVTRPEKSSDVNDVSGGVEMGGSVAKEKLSSLTEQIHLPHGAASFHCAMLGLDSAGKTTALYRLKFGQYMNAAPTIGFNCEKVREIQGDTSR